MLVQVARALGAELATTVCKADKAKGAARAGADLGQDAPEAHRHAGKRDGSPGRSAGST